jgi:triosephosphate isomerase (TIM)
MTGERRRPYIAGNWKMHKTSGEARAYVEELVPLVADAADRVDVALCVPFTALAACVEAARDTPVRIFAQTMHQAPEGAFTGEVSAPMLVDLGADGVVLGHSERRALFAETDRALQDKVPRALEAGLEPLLCVGETEEERENGDTERKLRAQVQEALRDVPDDRVSDVIIAYEPIWAIGSGKSATADQAQEAVAFIRALVADRHESAAEEVRILYGGSVKPDNAEELLGLPDVDGALIGGASLDADAFAKMVAAAPR